MTPRRMIGTNDIVNLKRNLLTSIYETFANHYGTEKFPTTAPFLASERLRLLEYVFLRRHVQSLKLTIRFSHQTDVHGDCT